ncbi:MAG: hypothetical protein N3E45_12910 [Oscillatoriaceae bacterium SKW80]|nr:hypothetical protein [Oscillatoriaceae bacterium SKYG93]MCX8121700.1 hypothetical protein [Oscillatoriaceae bacterium SKW80]MDW8453682.1 hypothetical protein [Oscillatoriaceae cyanobacterium SKYGB_i_bin93]
MAIVTKLKGNDSLKFRESLTQLHAINKIKTKPNRVYFGFGTNL